MLMIASVAATMLLTVSMSEDAFAHGRIHQDFTIDNDKDLLNGIGESVRAWMSHGDVVERLPDGFQKTAQSEGGYVAAMEDPKRQFAGVGGPKRTNEKISEGETIPDRLCICANWVPAFT